MSKRSFTFAGFVVAELSEKQRADLSMQSLTLEVLENTLIEVVQAGYKVSVSWDKDNSCYLALMMPAETTHDNAGWILSARSSEPVKAIKQLFYKHFTLLKEDWSRGMRKNTTWIEP